jgi:hypothetical protein
LKAENLAAWDQFVSMNRDGLIFHTSAWKRVLESAFSHIKGSVLALTDPRSGQIVAGIPLYTVRSWLLGNRLVSIPFASIAEPLVSTADEMAQLAPHFADSRGLTKPTMEFRGLRNGSVLDAAGFTKSSAFKHHYIPLGRGLDEIKSSLSRTAVRRMISKAAKSGLTVEKGVSETDLDIFYELFVQSRRRLELPPIPRAFFLGLWREFAPKNLDILVARRDGAAAGAVLGLKFKDHYFLEYSGDLPGAQKSGVNQLLYWEALKNAVNEGYKVFSFGRTSPENTGLREYKLHWGTVEEDLSVYSLSPATKVAAPREESPTYRMVKHLAGVAPMPLFRLLGKFCYAHWG